VNDFLAAYIEVPIFFALYVLEDFQEYETGQSGGDGYLEWQSRIRRKDESWPIHSPRKAVEKV
jgi:hypothetical protein